MKPPRIVLTFACSGCARPIHCIEVSGPGQGGVVIQRHHLKKVTPGCADRDCPIRWRDVRR